MPWARLATWWCWAGGRAPAALPALLRRRSEQLCVHAGRNPGHGVTGQLVANHRGALPVAGRGAAHPGCDRIEGPTAPPAPDHRWPSAMTRRSRLSSVGWGWPPPAWAVRSRPGDLFGGPTPFCIPGRAPPGSAAPARPGRGRFRCASRLAAARLLLPDRPVDGRIGVLASAARRLGRLRPTRPAAGRPSGAVARSAAGMPTVAGGCGLRGSRPALPPGLLPPGRPPAQRAGTRAQRPYCVYPGPAPGPSPGPTAGTSGPCPGGPDHRPPLSWAPVTTAAPRPPPAAPGATPRLCQDPRAPGMAPPSAEKRLRRHGAGRRNSSGRAHRRRTDGPRPNHQPPRPQARPPATSAAGPPSTRPATAPPPWAPPRQAPDRRPPHRRPPDRRPPHRRPPGHQPPDHGRRAACGLGASVRCG